MKIRSQEELAAFVDGQLAWRKKEVAALVGLINEAREFQKQTLVRAALALVYAHWEGFVKEAACAYCEYVRHRRPPLSRLHSSFVAVILRNRLRGSAAGRRIGPYIDALSLVMEAATPRSGLPADNIIDTESNLSFEVFQDIAQTIGLDVSEFDTKARLIDEGLVARRHKIAHGQRLDIDLRSFDELRGEVMWCMEAFRDKIQNAAATAAYLQGHRRSRISR